ncbi:MAG TPA: NADP-specific glutamate dehydrogenase [bacterium]|nr:NADP-specific glutamate dehydrogenase [bacterium]
MYPNVDAFISWLTQHNPGEPEFHQAVHEVVESIWPVLETNPKYQKANILERIVEPERVVMFRVPWVDDSGNVRVNKGYRVEMNSAIGPYKGGLRFHPNVNLSRMKFLAFEQTFKNSLTTLPMGGGKGGADFDPRDKTDGEVMRFCQSFMMELFRHIGLNTDVPAGDIGVGGREIGFLFGMYKKLRNEFSGVLTGKGLKCGGSLMRPEATGYGVAYFVQEMLKAKGESIEGKTVTISGYGNVGSFLVEKINTLGGKVITIGDEFGYVLDREGIAGEKLDFLKPLWTIYRRPAKDYADQFGLKWVPQRRPWEVPCDIAIPTATENELNGTDAEMLLHNGVRCVVEAANMPCTADAVQMFIDSKILYAPGKAANAGGVATSGLEMSQNSLRLSWPRDEVDNRLRQIMTQIHEECVRHGRENGSINYLRGSNIAGFLKVADAMLEQGVV